MKAAARVVAELDHGRTALRVLKGEAPIGRAATAATPSATETLGAGTYAGRPEDR